MSNKRCVIITACVNKKINKINDLKSDDFIICADGGYGHTKESEIIPHAIIGDFDSHPYEEIQLDARLNNTEVIKTIPEKDDTDTMMCAKYGLDKGYRDFLILGGLSKRLDHTMANLQMLSFLLDNGAKGWIIDDKNKATMIQGDDTITLNPSSNQYFSIYSFSDVCRGIYEINSKYTLTDATITNSNPVGTSNEFLDEPVILKIKSGKLLITISKKD